MKEIIEKGLILEGGEFTATQLRDKLIEVFGTKPNGKEILNNDIYQYIYRGSLPFSFGGNSINVIERSRQKGFIKKVQLGKRKTSYEQN